MERYHNNAGKLVPVIILLIAIAAGAGGFFAYKTFLADPGPDYQMTEVRLTDEIVDFLYRSIPDVYHRLAQISHEIELIQQEINRLETIEKEYPKQKKIVIAEKKMWGGLRKELTAVLDDMQKNIESLFVAYSVNSEKGTEMLPPKQEEILNATADILETSRQQTARLKQEEKKGIIDQLKAKISG